MKPNFFKVLIYLIMFWGSIAQAYTSQSDDAHPFTIYYDSEAAYQVEDQQVTVDILFSIPKNHHLYAESIAVEIERADLDYTLVKPTGIVKFDEFMGKETEIFKNELAVLLKIRVSKDFDFSEPVLGEILYQGCSDKICFRGMSEPLKIELASAQTEPEAKSSLLEQEQTDSQTQEDDDSLKKLLKISDYKNLLERGFGVALLVTFLAGLLTGFTPCVLPIIPLTLAFIGVRGQKSAWTKIWHLAIFVLGMSTMYAILGVSTAYFGRSLGFLYQNNFFIIFLIVFFVLMALSLFGVFQVTLPNGLQNKLASYQPQGPWRNFGSG